LKMEACYNSIEPRKGTELFIQLQKWWTKKSCLNKQTAFHMYFLVF
jgi:hypothetical protein